ncbi:lanthionine synthetase C family protein [Haliangium sp.]|uniref:lanthionine synthetase C family protein n=1 Tax=Haliangium sp. TaxID=2663208 RepID=UPI003D0A8D8A
MTIHPAPTASWRPLVTDPEERARIVAIVDDIAAAVAASPQPDDGVDALCDRALLMGYLGHDDHGDVGAAALSAAVARVADSDAGVALFGGAARLGWVVAHMATGAEADALCDAIDDLLGDSLAGPCDGDYDLISGLVGLGVYALERCESASGRALALRVLDHLEHRAEPAGPGLAWFTRPALLVPWQRALAPHGYYNLGLAHGIPGVIALLARYADAGIDAARARTLLDGAVTYLLSAAPPRPTPGAGRYPHWLPRGIEGTPRRPSELPAWCYGDLGVSVALLSAARACENPDWHADAMALATSVALRTDDEASMVDTSLCHGAAGAAHMFNRLYQASGDPAMAAAARRWLSRTLELRRGPGLIGFPARRSAPDGSTVWRPDASLLVGAPGVALMLHAATSDAEPRWDRLLLADIPPRAHDRDEHQPDTTLITGAGSQPLRCDSQP